MMLKKKTMDNYTDLASRRLQDICLAFDVDPEREANARSTLGTLMRSWYHSPIGDHPTVLSDISDDHTPFEFSLGFRNDGVDLRFLVEAQPATPQIESRWEAGRALLEALQKNHDCCIDRFLKVEDLFRPTDQWARFAMWHAVNIGKKTSFKVYLNPAASGAHNASRTVRAALYQLDIGDAAGHVPQLLHGRDEVKYFSLDLTKDLAARVKVYFSHRNVDAGFLEMMLSPAPGYVSGTAEEFCRKLSDGRFIFDGLPIQTCYSFNAINASVSDVALHFPVRSYAHDDGEALERISTLLNEPHREQYRSLVQKFSGDMSQSGVQTYASIWAGRRRELTVYLSPQIFSGAKARTKEAR